MIIIDDCHALLSFNFVYHCYDGLPNGIKMNAVGVFQPLTFAFFISFQFYSLIAYDYQHVLAFHGIPISLRIKLCCLLHNILASFYGCQ